MDRDPRQRPRYVPRPAKAVEVILWLSDRCPGIDVYHVVKAVFFADKWHIAEYGRPIVGDDYDAAPFGPLPRVVYGLLRFEPIEILAAGVNGRLPFTVNEAFQVSPDRQPNLRRLSESDQKALAHGLAMVRDKTFEEIYAVTHEDPAYVNAAGGKMDYRDFIPEDDPEREAKAEDLTEVARYAVL